MVAYSAEVEPAAVALPKEPVGSPAAIGADEDDQVGVGLDQGEFVLAPVHCGGVGVVEDVCLSVNGCLLGCSDAQ